MSSFFNVSGLGGNPFSTIVGQKIEQATDASLPAENWAINMEICDLINESSDTARDAMKAIRKRMTQNVGKNYKVLKYTLIVLETCVKNCGRAFHILVTNKEFITELFKMTGPKTDPPSDVQDKILSLIQVWAEAFQNQPELNGVVQFYQELKGKGVIFPNASAEAIAPIYTPQRSVPESVVAPIVQQTQMLDSQVVPGSPANCSAPKPLEMNQITKLQSELDIVMMNMSIYGEMLNELKPLEIEAAELVLLGDLSKTCKEMQGRIVELIGKINNDEITAELLRLNDELNNLFLRHTRFENNRESIQHTVSPSTILGNAIGIPMNMEGGGTNAKESLIDFNDEGPQRDANQAAFLASHMSGLGFQSVGAQGTTGSISCVTGQPDKTTAAKSGDLDEFDLLAHSRNNGSIDYTDDPTAATKRSITGGSNLNSSIPTKSKQENIPRESEFDEMAAWLDANPPPTVAVGENHEESLTSKEFDRFLAERAAAAENITPGSDDLRSGGSAAAKQTPPQHQRNRKVADQNLLL